MVDGAGKFFRKGPYLQRIGIRDGGISPTQDSLERLHRGQAYSIPFENFDILLGRPLDLSTGGLFKKLVLSLRGGYCFELNNLFLTALIAFGFNARPLMARVHLTGKPTGREHQLSLVTINGRRWIADVGFGVNGLRAPIPFEVGRVDHQEGEEYRLVPYEPFGTMLQVRAESDWRNLFSFDLGYVCKGDIQQANYYTETNPDSFLTFMRVACRPIERGRVSLMDYRLRKTTESGVEEFELSPGPSYLMALEKHFGIRLNAPYELLEPQAL